MKTLNHHQRYLLEEFAQDYFERSMSRRDLLHRSLMATGSVVLTGTALFALGCTSDDDEGDPLPAVSPAAATATASNPTEPAATASPSGPPATVPPPSTGAEVSAEAISFPGPGGEIFGYLARPEGDAIYPAILIIHENRGLLPHFEDVARRYAAEGFVAFAIDMASRLGGSQVAGQQVGQIDPEDLVADLQAAIDHLKDQEYVDAEAIGVTGFCFGGGYTFDIAAASPDIKAAVPYYGTARRALETGLDQTTAAVLVVYGETDTRITSERPDVEAALEASGAPYRIDVYPAGHAFFNDTGGSYNQAAATAAWDATLAWFREHLV